MSVGSSCLMTMTEKGGEGRGARGLRSERKRFSFLSLSLSLSHVTFFTPIRTKTRRAEKNPASKPEKTQSIALKTIS